MSLYYVHWTHNVQIIYTGKNIIFIECSLRLHGGHDLWIIQIQGPNPTKRPLFKKRKYEVKSQAGPSMKMRPRKKAEMDRKKSSKRTSKK